MGGSFHEGLMVAGMQALVCMHPHTGAAVATDRKQRTLTHTSTHKIQMLIMIINNSVTLNCMQWKEHVYNLPYNKEDLAIF
jgi:hypothetical protein